MEEREKPELTYPREWEFTVIGRDKEKVEEAIKEVLKDKEHNFKFGNLSKNGKFSSYKAKCTVDTKEERDEIYKKFGNHQDIDYIL
jgi:putative lipoic acid-binding regulatory protein